MMSANFNLGLKRNVRAQFALPCQNDVSIEFRKSLTLAALGSTCLFSACNPGNSSQMEGDSFNSPTNPIKTGDQQEIVLLRSYVTTNHVPGYVGAPEIKPTIDSNGWQEFQATPAVAIRHPPRTEVVTNFVLGYRQGTNTVEVMTTEKR
jgi:hypothetical protein